MRLTSITHLYINTANDSRDKEPLRAWLRYESGRRATPQLKEFASLKDFVADQKIEYPPGAMAVASGVSGTGQDRGLFRGDPVLARKVDRLPYYDPPTQVVDLAHDIHIETQVEEQLRAVRQHRVTKASTAPLILVCDDPDLAECVYKDHFRQLNQKYEEAGLYLARLPMDLKPDQVENTIQLHSGFLYQLRSELPRDSLVVCVVTLPSRVEPTEEMQRASARVVDAVGRAGKDHHWVVVLSEQQWDDVRSRISSIVTHVSVKNLSSRDAARYIVTHALAEEHGADGALRRSWEGAVEPVLGKGTTLAVVRGRARTLGRVVQQFVQDSPEEASDVLTMRRTDILEKWKEDDPPRKWMKWAKTTVAVTAVGVAGAVGVNYLAAAGTGAGSGENVGGGSGPFPVKTGADDVCRPEDAPNTFGQWGEIISDKINAVLNFISEKVPDKIDLQRLMGYAIHAGKHANIMADMLALFNDENWPDMVYPAFRGSADNSQFKGVDTVDFWNTFSNRLESKWWFETTTHGTTLLEWARQRCGTFFPVNLEKEITIKLFAPTDKHALVCPLKVWYDNPTQNITIEQDGHSTFLKTMNSIKELGDIPPVPEQGNGMYSYSEYVLKLYCILTNTVDAPVITPDMVSIIEPGVFIDRDVACYNNISHHDVKSVKTFTIHVTVKQP